MQQSFDETIDLVLSDKNMSIAEAMIRICTHFGNMENEVQMEILSDLQHAYVWNL